MPEHTPMPTVEMLPGDVALIRRPGIEIPVLPTFANLVNFSAQQAGWSEAPYYLIRSARILKTPLPGRKNNLFGQIDIQSGVSLHPPIKMKNGEQASSALDLAGLFSDDDHTPVMRHYIEGFNDRWNPGNSTGVSWMTELDAFALIPGRYPRPKDRNQSSYADSFRKAHPYSSSRNWRLFRGLFYTVPKQF